MSLLTDDDDDEEEEEGGARDFMMGIWSSGPSGCTKVTLNNSLLKYMALNSGAVIPAAE